jgi:hypothetical protein
LASPFSADAGVTSHVKSGAIIVQNAH